MIFWINLYAFVFTLRLSWILNTQMVSPCQLCCLVGVCWWWQENLDTFGPTGRYRNDLDDRVPFALWEFSFFLLWATRTMPHVCMLSLLGLNPQGQLWLFFFFFSQTITFYFENSNLKKSCKHDTVHAFTFHLDILVVNILPCVLFVSYVLLSLFLLSHMRVSCRHHDHYSYVLHRMFPVSEVGKRWPVGQIQHLVCFYTAKNGFLHFKRVVKNKSSKEYVVETVCWPLPKIVTVCLCYRRSLSTPILYNCSAVLKLRKFNIDKILLKDQSLNFTSCTLQYYHKKTRACQ